MVSFFFFCDFFFFVCSLFSIFLALLFLEVSSGFVQPLCVVCPAQPLHLRDFTEPGVFRANHWCSFLGSQAPGQGTRGQFQGTGVLFGGRKSLWVTQKPQSKHRFFFPGFAWPEFPVWVPPLPFPSQPELHQWLVQKGLPGAHPARPGAHLAPTAFPSALSSPFLRKSLTLAIFQHP